MDCPAADHRFLGNNQLGDRSFRGLPLHSVICFNCTRWIIVSWGTAFKVRLRTCTKKAEAHNGFLRRRKTRAITLWGSFAQSSLLLEEISSRQERLSIVPSDIELSGSSPSQLLHHHQHALIESKAKRNARILCLGLLLTAAAVLAIMIGLIADTDDLFGTVKCFRNAWTEYIMLGFGVAMTLLSLGTIPYLAKVDDEIGLRHEIQRNSLVLALTHVVILLLLPNTAVRSWLPLTLVIQQMLLLIFMTISPFYPGLSIEIIGNWIETKKRVRPNKRSDVPAYGQPIPRMRLRTSTALRNSIVNRRNSTAVQGGGGTSRETISWDAGLW